MAESNNEELREQMGRLQSQQAIDPTANVLEHVRLHSLRQDDLRKAEGDYMRREMGLRAEHARQLGAAEKERLDAIRSIDAQAIQLAGAEAKAMSDRIMQQLATTATLLQDRIGAVERQQYVNAGTKIQQVESRGQNQWGVTAAGMVLGLGIAAAGVAIALA